MKYTCMKIVLAAMVVVGMGLAMPAQGEVVLIDFGNDTSYRGASVVGGIDQNGNSWNSVDSSVYWIDLVDTTGTGSGINFGFGSVGGTDSWNGPAGDAFITPPSAQIDTVALGLLGVTNAAYDYYVNSTFTLQNLDPTKQYNLTFYGSHRHDIPGISTYTVYTSNDYSTVVSDVQLANNQYIENGWQWEHNQDEVAQLNNVDVQWANSIWIGVDGYINSMSIEVVPEPATFGLLGLAGAGLLVMRRLRRG